MSLVEQFEQIFDKIQHTDLDVNTICVPFTLRNDIVGRLEYSNQKLGIIAGSMNLHMLKWQANFQTFLRQ